MANKSLLAVAAAYDALPSGGQVVLKYNVDGGAWTTVFTETTTGKVVTEQGLDATGTAFTSGREYRFRLESSGGVLLTGLKYKYEVLQTLL